MVLLPCDLLSEPTARGAFSAVIYQPICPEAAMAGNRRLRAAVDGLPCPYLDVVEFLTYA
jgi:hypothetical protein